jgi:hypothetical protein
MKNVNEAPFQWYTHQINTSRMRGIAGLLDNCLYLLEL